MSEIPAAGPILCLGEALVDLVCEAELDSPSDAEEFQPRFGGALANVAVAAARAGGNVALAGGVGDDTWGHWLRERLEAEGVGLGWFSLVPGIRTPIAFVTFDRSREPAFSVYGDGIGAAMDSVAARIGDAVSAAGALVFGSNTLVSEPERGLTDRARKLAAETGTPVVFDPNLRPNRWTDLELGIERCREAVPGCHLVRANLDEAQRIAGLPAQSSPADAAEALCALGARNAVVTTGPGIAVARGDAHADVYPPHVDVVSPLGAGDAFLGTLAAGAAAGGWSGEAIAAAMPAAVEAGARACTAWEAVG